MREKSLRIYLAKAKYLLVFLKEQSPPPNSMSLHGLRIPSLNFSNILKSSDLNRSTILKRPLPTEEQVDNLKKVAFSSKTTQISLVTDKNSVSQKTSNVARDVSSVSRQQNLHLLHIGMIYYANKEKEKSIKGWKVPSLVHVSRQFQTVFKAPLITPSNSSIRKYKLIRNLHGELLEDEEGEKDNLALEKEYSHRRNYITTRSLHT